jgi:Chaperone of endosialidase
MIANYGGKINNNSSYIRGFIPGQPTQLWKTLSYSNDNVLTPNSPNYESVYIPGNLYVDGSIINPSDINLKHNIEVLNPILTNKLDELKPSKYTLKDDKSNAVHYGFIAQELEQVLPELVVNKPTTSTHNQHHQIKAINYLELIPLLVHKVQILEKRLKKLEG